MKPLWEMVGTWCSDKISAAVGLPTQEELQKLRNRILIFSAVIPLVNIGSFIYQCFGDSTNGLRIEAFLLIVFSVIFVVNVFLQDKNDMNVTRFIGLSINSLSIVLLLVITIHGSLILCTLIASGDDLWIPLIILLVLSVIEFDSTEVTAVKKEVKMAATYAAGKVAKDAADIEQMEKDEKEESDETRKAYIELFAVIFLVVCPIVNTTNCIAQFIIDGTTGLCIELFVLMLLSILFIINVDVYESDKIYFSTARIFGTILLISSFAVLLVINVHGFVILYSQISSGAGHTSTVVLLAFTVLELAIGVLLLIICLSYWKEWKLEKEIDEHDKRLRNWRDRCEQLQRDIAKARGY